MSHDPDAPRSEEEQEEQEGGPVKTFLEHLEDLRWMLIKSCVTLAIAMVVCLAVANHIIGILKWPLLRADLNSGGGKPVLLLYVGTNQLGWHPLTTNQAEILQFGSNRMVALELQPVTIGSNTIFAFQASTNAEFLRPRPKVDLINLAPAAGFVVAFRVALYGGIVLAAPFLLFFVAQFAMPALRKIEKKYFVRGFWIGLALFFTGVSFCYFILMPMVLDLSVKYSEWLGFSAYQWRAEEYISFVCRFMLGMGLGFEMPIVILCLVKIGIVDYKMLAGFRRYMVVINLVLGAVLTTPEILTQVMMFIPLQCMYEISVWIAWYWERQDRKKQELEEKQNRS